MKAKKMLLILIPLIILITLAIILHKPNNLEKYEKFSGENEYGKVILEREDYIYKYSFIPNNVISKDHIKGDAYIFDFYTENDEQRFNCSINVFTNTIESSVHSEFIQDKRNLKAFYKVVITTKSGTYIIPISKQ